MAKQKLSKQFLHKKKNKQMQDKLNDKQDVNLELDDLAVVEEGQDSKIEPQFTTNGDDPDKVPVTPSLRDDEVPNMPGAILKHAREMLGLSQREVASRLKMRVNTVSDIEHDRLNQPTAAQFTRTHLKAYAQLVNLDEKTIIELYDRNVELVIDMQERQEKVVSKAKYYLHYIPWVVGVVALASVSLYLFTGDDVDTEKPVVLDNGEIDLSKTTVGDETAYVLEESSQAETQDNKTTKEELPQDISLSDINTLRATSQSEAIKASEAKNQSLEEQKSDKVEDIVVLETKAHTSIATKEDLAKAKEERLYNELKVNKKEVDLTKKAVSESVTASNKEKISGQVLEIKKEPEIKANSKAVEEQKDATLDTALATNDTDKTVKESVKLASNLRDISSLVSIKNREGLASMNTVEIVATGDVFVEVASSSRVLLSKALTKGQKVSVTGIPPMKVKLSDTTKARIGYMGGTVSVPSQKQVSFTLPTK